MKKTPKIVAIICGIIACISGGLGVGLLTHKTSAMVAYEDLFVGTKVYSTFSSAPISIDAFDNRSGLLFTAMEEDASVRFVDTASGPFEMDYRVISEKTSFYDMKSLRLLFTDVHTADFFAVEIGLTADDLTGLNSTSSSQVRAVVDTGSGKGYGVDKAYKWLTTYGVSVGSSYCNLNTDSIVVRFDPTTMQVCVRESKSSEENLIIDLDDATHLAQSGRKTPFSDFSEYCVDIQFDRFETNADKANIIVYSLFGNAIDSAFLSKTAGASVYVNTDENVKVGESYDLLKSVKAYDLLEGQIPFNGEIGVTAPDGSAVAVENNSFTPLAAGAYALEYRAKNNAGIVGPIVKAELKAVDYEESFSYTFGRPFSDRTVGTGATVSLPVVTAQSSYMDGKTLPCALTIKKDGVEKLAVAAAVSELEYTFEEKGTYTVTYAVLKNGQRATEKNYTVTVTSDVPAFVGDLLESAYTYGTTLTVPTKTATFNGGSYETTTQVIFKDGRTNGYSSVLLDCEGVCEVRYTANIEDTLYTDSEYFLVNKNAEGLWNNLGGVTIAGNTDLPDYADVYGNGVKLTTSRAGSVVEYANTLNLADSNLQTPVIEAMMTPTEAGVQEVPYFEMRLTDVNDENNFITVRVGNFGSVYKYISYVVCGANLGYELVGNKGRKMGSKINTSVLGKYNDSKGCYPSLPFAIYYDAQTKSVYAGWTDNGRQTLKIVARLDDAAFVGEGNEWAGFSTGEVKLQVRFDTLMYSPANFTILSVCGQSMAGETLSDKTPPRIFLDGYEEGNAPNALVNNPYPVFKGELSDVVDGALGEMANVSVYYYENGEKKYLLVENGAFTPPTAGTYYVEYFGMDNANNVAQKTVAVEAVLQMPALIYTPNSEVVSQAFVGETIAFPSGVASGGAGSLQIERTITNGSELVGVGEEFQFLHAGNYTYTVKITDYVGQQKLYTYPISVTVSQTPVVEEKLLPKAIAVGKQYVFPAFKATQYADGMMRELTVSVSVNGTELDETLAYTPTEKGKLVVTYETDGWSKSFDVSAVMMENTETYLKDYFISTDGSVQVESQEDYITFLTDGNTAKDGRAEVSFINALGITGANIQFFVLKNNFKQINLYLTDSENADEQLKLTVKKSDTVSNKSIFMLNDGYERNIVGSFYENQMRDPLALVVKGNKIYDYKDTLLDKIDKTLSGKVFKGFTSGKVYLSFEFEGVTGASAIGLSTLWNQELSATYSDYISPIVSVNSLDGKILKGDLVTIPQVTAFDVLDTNVTMALTVKCGSVYMKNATNNEELKKLIMKDGETYSFIASEFGKYEIEIAVSDSSQNAYIYRDVFYIDSTVDPIMTIGKKPNASYKVGERMSVPTATATDYQGNALQVYVYVIDINGRYHDLLEANTEKRYKPTEVGTYYIVYYAYDSFGNYVMQKFAVKVVAGG